MPSRRNDSTDHHEILQTLYRYTLSGVQKRTKGTFYRVNASKIVGKVQYFNKIYLDDLKSRCMEICQSFFQFTIQSSFIHESVCKKGKVFRAVQSACILLRTSVSAVCPSSRSPTTSSYYLRRSHLRNCADVMLSCLQTLHDTHYVSKHTVETIQQLFLC